MAVCRFFEEDEVCVPTMDNRVLYGLVFQSSEYLSSDEYSDDEDVTERLKRGTVEVSWHPDSKGTEAVLPEKDVCLADRSLMPGDVVRRLVEGKDSQRGYVIDIQSVCHVNIGGTDKYINNIDTKDLLPLQVVYLDPGIVTMDSWVGKIDEVETLVTLRFPDGARCQIDGNSFDSFVEPRRNKFSDDYCIPAAGEVVKGCIEQLSFLCAKWLNSTGRFNCRTYLRKPKQHVTVYTEEVSVSSVSVHWMCKGFREAEDTSQNFDPPDWNITGENIYRLKNLESYHSTIQLGDRCFYIIKPTDVLETKSPNSFPPEHLKHLLSQAEYKAPAHKPSGAGKAGEEAGNKDNAGEDSSGSFDQGNNSMENVDQTVIESQNGILNGCGTDILESNVDAEEKDDDYEDLDSDSDNESNHSSNSLNSSRHNNRRKKSRTVTATFKKKMKAKLTQKNIPFPEVSTKVGDKVLVDIRYTYSLASVMWQDGTVEENVSSVDLYPIHHLDPLEFFPGDYVVGSKETCKNSEYGVIVKCDHLERTCLVKHMKAYEVGKDSRPIEVKPDSEVSVYDIKDHPYFKFRPGHVVIRVGGFHDCSGPREASGLVLKTNPDGTIEVKWADDSISLCYPQELYIASDEMSEFGSDSEWTSESESDGSEKSDESWETEDEEILEDADSEEVKQLQAQEDNAEKTLNLEISLAFEKLNELSKLLDRAHEALDRSDLVLGTHDDDMDIPRSMLRVAGIFHDIFKICKHFDKICKSSCFTDVSVQFDDLLSELKMEVRRKRYEKVFRHYSKMLAKDGKPKAEEEKRKNDDISVNTCVSSTEITNNGAENTGVGEKCNRGVKGEKLKTEEGKIPSEYDKTVSQGGAGTAVGGASALLEPENDFTAPDSKAKLLFRTVYNVLKDKMKVMQDEVNKALHCENSVTAGQVNGQTGDSDTASTTNGNVMEGGESASASGPALGTVGFDGALEHLLTNLYESDIVSPESEDSRYKEVPNVTSTTTDIPAHKSPTKGFTVCESAPSGHKFRGKSHSPKNTKAFMSAIKNELSLLKSSLPDGIFVKSYEDRMDLCSVMIIGPANTPYEDGLFFFDVQLPNDYPKGPPSFHYISYCEDRLNPNLYEDGKVCVSLLGTWSGKGNEVWTDQSNMLQVLISIQGLILNSEPYYNEAGFERQRGSQQGHENSKMYNEMAALKLAQSMASIAVNPPEVFQSETRHHILDTAPRMIKRLKGWVMHSEYDREIQAQKKSGQICCNGSPVDATSLPTSKAEKPTEGPSSATGLTDGPTAAKRNGRVIPPEVCDSPHQNLVSQPEFPLLPASKGFCMTIYKHIKDLEIAFNSIKGS